jgi:hypothetical protein
MPGRVRTGRCFCGNVEIAIEGQPAAQAYCHCSSCRGWLGAPIHAATLWPTPNVNVRKGADGVGMTKRTEASLRHFCKACGAPVLIRMTDVPAGMIEGLTFAPTLHVHYGEKVLAVRDGLPKFRDFPKEFGGSGVTLPE